MIAIVAYREGLATFANWGKKHDDIRLKYRRRAVTACSVDESEDISAARSPEGSALAGQEFDERRGEMGSVLLIVRPPLFVR